MVSVDWSLLLKQALQSREHAYCPYSHYMVGASLLTKKGIIYTGCNIENATYTPTICAERTALFKAVSEGERQFVAMAVVTSNGATPCGVCRQVIREFAPDIQILIGDTSGQYRIVTLEDLLPQSFGPQSLIVE